MGRKTGGTVTKAEVVGLIIGSVGTVAAIIAAWASVAERLEKRRERRALKLTRIQEALLFIAWKQPGEEIRVGSYVGGKGLLVAPGLDGECIVIESDDPLKRLVVSEYLVLTTVTAAVHGPPEPSNHVRFTNVSFYRLSLKGREMALRIPAAVAVTEIQKSGLKGTF